VFGLGLNVWWTEYIPELYTHRTDHPFRHRFWRPALYTIPHLRLILPSLVHVSQKPHGYFRDIVKEVDEISGCKRRIALDLALQVP
jgi:hypothetical protein